MKQLLKLFTRTFEVSTATLLVYRANVIFFFVFETLFLASQFLTISVGFNLAGDQIAGWTRQQAYLLTAVNGMSHQIFICFFINPIFNLSVQVWNGQFDYILLKPQHPLVSLIANGQFVISNIPNMLINAGVVGYLLSVNRAAYTPGMLPVFILFVVLGVAVRVGLALLCMAPVFISERLSDVEDSFWSVTNLARYPLSVFPRSLVHILTFVVPIGMLASVPSESLFHPRSVFFWGAAAAAAAVFVVVCVKVFMRAMKGYQSVNSGA
jgi:ABC-2 type transport system permease protein